MLPRDWELRIDALDNALEAMLHHQNQHPRLPAVRVHQLRGILDWLKDFKTVQQIHEHLPVDERRH
jgi:hypothetical protein